MKTRRIIYMAGSVLVAYGVLILLLISLSSVAKAHATTASTPSGKEEVTVDRWRILADLQFGLGSPGVVSFQNKIHVISGFYEPGTGDSSSAQVVYDPLSNTWQYLWDVFPVPRSNMVIADVDDRLYAIGGWNSDLESVYSYTHRYEPTSHTVVNHDFDDHTGKWRGRSGDKRLHLRHWWVRWHYQHKGCSNIQYDQ